MEELRELKLKMRSVISQSRQAVPKSMKRMNKKRPKEMSSKQRERPEVANKIVRRDPRFDEACGSFDEKIFDGDYYFLNDVRKREVQVLQNRLKKEKDPKEKAVIEGLMKRLKDQERELVKRKEDRELEDKVRKQALEATGKPFINKSQVKAAKLVDQFKTLKKAGKLDKYLEKKRKKNTSIERKKTPFS